jgi:hypothetical protein
MNNSKTVIRHLNILTHMKDKRKKDKNGKFYRLYKIISIKPAEEQWKPVVSAVAEITGGGVEASTILQAINAIMNPVTPASEPGETRLEPGETSLEPGELYCASKLFINSNYWQGMLEKDLSIQAELKRYAEYEQWQTEDEYANDYVPF